MRAEKQTMRKSLLIPLFICLVSRSGLALPASVGDIVLNDCQLLKIDSAGAHLRSAKGAELLIPLDRIPEGLKTQFPNEYQAAIKGGNEQQGQAGKNVVIKGLYLGMKMDDAVTVLSSFRSGDKFMGEVKTLNYNKGEEAWRAFFEYSNPPLFASATLSFDSEKKLTRVYMGGVVFAHVFKLDGMSNDELLRSFETAYGLSKFKRQSLGELEWFSSVTSTGVEVKVGMPEKNRTFEMKYQNKGSFN